MSYIKKNTDTEFCDFTEYRDRLFYNLFEYKLSCNSLGLRFCRKNQTLEQYFTNQRIPNWSDEKYLKKFTDNQSILNYLDAIKQCEPSIKIRNEADSFSIFSNDLTLLNNYRDDLDSYVGSSVITRAVPDLETGVLYFVKEPKFKYRTYFKPDYQGDMTEVRDRLATFIAKYKNHVKCNYRLRRFINREMRYWFYTGLYNCSIDYSDLRLQSLICMTMNNIIDRHFELRQRPTGL